MYFCCVQPPKTKESTGEEESTHGMWREIERERKNVMERGWREIALLPTMILNFIETKRERVCVKYMKASLYHSLAKH